MSVDTKTNSSSFWIKQEFIPPLQPLLLWQSLSLFWLCGLMAARFPLGGILAATIILLLDKRLWQKLRFFIAFDLFALGFLIVHILIIPRPDYPTWAMQGQKLAFSRIEGHVTKVESLSDKRLRITLSDVRSMEHEEAPPLPGLMIWTWEQTKHKENINPPINPPIRPVVGQSVQINARIRTTESFGNWGSSDFGFYWQSQGVFWRIWSRGSYGNPQIINAPKPIANVRHKTITKLNQTLFTPNFDHASTKGQAYAFLPALLFGEKYYLAHESIDHMRAASLIHSLALSGQHLALVGLSAVMIMSCIYLFFPKILLILPHTKWLGLLSLPLAVLYLWLGNAPPSLIRAALMLTLALMFHWRMRATTLSDTLLMTLLLITCYSPMAIFNLGLQLSVLCVASIVLVLPLLRRIPKIELQNKSALKIFLAKLGRGVVQIFIISFTIQLALLPIFLYYFNSFGLWFISNILWLPVLGFWVLPVAAMGLFLVCIWPNIIFAKQVLHLAAWPCQALLELLQWMQNKGLFEYPLFLRPHWTTFLAWACLCVALALLVGRVTLRNFFKNNYIKPMPHAFSLLTFVALCALFSGPIIRYAGYHLKDTQIELLDVGQGQAVCITLKGGERVLVDGGGSTSPRFDIGANIVIPRLIYNAPPRLFAVISTHADTDHLRGLIAVLEHMQVGTFYHNGKDFGRAHTRKLTAIQDNLPKQEILSTGMNIALPSMGNNLKLEVLNPPKINKLSSNNASIVLRLVHENNNIKQGIALLGADAEIPALQHILRLGQDIQSSILILPHHGAKDALLPAFYKATNAQVALASTGKYNNFAFPHPSVQKALEQNNIPIYTTANYGAIIISWRNNTHSYEQNKPLTPPTLYIKTQNQTTRLALQDILR